MGRLPIEPGDQDAQPLQVASQTFDRQGAVQRVEDGLGLDVPQARAASSPSHSLDPSGQHLPRVRRGRLELGPGPLDRLPQLGEPSRRGSAASGSGRRREAQPSRGRPSSRTPASMWSSRPSRRSAPSRSAFARPAARAGSHQLVRVRLGLVHGHRSGPTADLRAVDIPCSLPASSGHAGKFLRKNRSQLPWKMSSIAGVGVAAAGQDLRQLLEVGDPIQADGGLLGAEAAVEVAADRGVAAVAGELADVVDVVGDGLEADDLARGLAPDPAGREHPGVEGRADDGAALDQEADLLVAELPAVGDQGPAVVVAGQHRAAEDVEAPGRSWCRRGGSRRGSCRAARTP